MDRRLSFQQPLQWLLILTLCVGGLALHLFTENLGPSSWAAVLEMVEHGRLSDPTHESHEDTFVLPSLGRPSPVDLFMPVAVLMALHFSSIFISPLLPPPNNLPSRRPLPLVP